jgi:hypothetical protein
MKILFKFIGVLLLLLILTVFYAVMFRVGPRVETAIETILPAALGTKVTIENMTVLPLHGSVQLYGLSIANPKEFSNPIVAEAKKIKLVIDLRSLLTDTLVLKEIQVDSAVFNYEHRHRTDNLKVLHKNLTTYLANRKAERTDAEKAAAAKKPARKVIIERFILTDGKVNAKATGLPLVPIPLENIILIDIGKNTGGTSWGKAGTEIGAAISAAVMNVVSNLRDLTRIALKSTGTAALNTSADVMHRATDASGRVIHGVTDAGDRMYGGATNAGSTVVAISSHLLNSIEGLFKKKEE